jgi:hypothetical protein
VGRISGMGVLVGVGGADVGGGWVGAGGLVGGGVGVGGCEGGSVESGVLVGKIQKDCVTVGVGVPLRNKVGVRVRV